MSSCKCCQQWWGCKGELPQMLPAVVGAQLVSFRRCHQWWWGWSWQALADTADADADSKKDRAGEHLQTPALASVVGMALSGGTYLPMPLYQSPMVELVTEPAAAPQDQ